MSYLKFLTSQQMRLSETNGATREKYAAAMVKDASIVDDVVGSQSSSAADDAIAAALDAARHAKSGGGANDAADAAAATFAAVGKSSNGGGRSAAEKFSDDWDKEREAGATSIQRAEWLAMSTTERDAEMAVRGERATRVYTFQSRWNQLLDTLANKQKMMHGKAFKGFWDTRDLLQHVQTMEREVFKWLEGHKREGDQGGDQARGVDGATRRVQRGFGSRIVARSERRRRGGCRRRRPEAAIRRQVPLRLSQPAQEPRG
jgi:hypothetical protein